ncbi:MAG: bifunctional precorrin-2 dehydrogenase/sirohydrochlorin ferrochelatase [Alphaproteobacteria bacterium]
MIPIALDPAALAVALVGRGDLAVRRFGALQAGGAHRLAVYSDAPRPLLVQAARERLVRRLPTAGDLQALNVLWIADLPAALAHELAAAARAAKVLVNVEDDRANCDFHNVAQVRRGDLLLTASTNGASPGLAAMVREQLERTYTADWADRLERLRGQRQQWRAEGRTMEEVGCRTRAAVAEERWLR